jgi:toxin ParE1/3/4
MSRRFLLPAQEEMQQAARFYENRIAGLGRSFLNGVEQAIAAVAQRPELGHRVSGNIRRYLLRRFPFGILYAK